MRQIGTIPETTNTLAINRAHRLSPTNSNQLASSSSGVVYVTEAGFSEGVENRFIVMLFYSW
jgi:hypothetical protein